MTGTSGGGRTEPLVPEPPPPPRPNPSGPWSIVLLVVGLAGLAVLALRADIGSAPDPVVAWLVAMTVAWTVTLIERGRRWLGHRRLATTGLTVVATVSAVTRQWGGRFGRRPNRHVYEFELNGVRYRGSDKSLAWGHHKGDLIWVVYDPHRPERNMAWPPFTDRASLDHLVERFDAGETGGRGQ